MSEENKVITDNLCTTEDAFEKFQAISMYEEDEYITLSDIIPPETATPNTASDIDEIPYDNEVVLSSNTENEPDDGKFNSELGTEEKILVATNDLPPVDTSFNIEPAVEETIPVQNVDAKPKRGRKKKSYIENNILTDISIENESFVTQDNNIVENKSVETSKQYSRRGRKPKNYDSFNNTATLLNSSEIVKKSVGRKGRPRKVAKEVLSVEKSEPHANGDNQQNEIINEEIKKTQDLPIISNLVKKRRGRPKKSLLNQSVAPETEKQPFSDITSSDLATPANSEVCDSTLDESVKKISSKRGRPKKRVDVTIDEAVPQIDSVNVSVVEDDDNLSLSQYSKKNLGKRGRPKRLPPEEMSIPHEEQVVMPENYPTREINLGDDDTDDISLSRLKDTMDTSVSDNLETDITVDNKNTDELTPLDIVKTEDNKANESPSKRNCRPPTMPDFEYNVDIVVGETINNEVDGEQLLYNENEIDNDSFLIEDTSKRPIRRKTKQALHYDEGSDEDPYANMELSDDDEPQRGRKGKRYYSDEEYVPGRKRGRNSSLDESDSDIDVILQDVSKAKRKRGRNSGSVGKSPKKKGKTADNSQETSKCSPNVTTIHPDDDILNQDDIEVCLQSSVIKANDDSSQKSGWGSTNEFENFIAKKINGTELKIKKVNSARSSQSAPLDIPIINPNELKKTVEMCTQTNTIETTSVTVQTTSPYEVPMKENVHLSIRQSEEACEFLKSVVKTTSELGQLMTQKSDDFIAKKINVDHVTDTFKMDYCVRKSFLLFKLAKHNLVQMEEDLSKQYEEFLRSNNLLACREQPKKILPKKKEPDNDSDCEIVEEPTQPIKVKEKPKFNPKTVFLNKELSIKIAKKSTAPEDKKGKEKLNIKGRHTVWISDSVMVKKVKPTQSFLAQDSRNKKPPDYYVTEKMVSDFFKKYFYQQAQSICAPYTSTEWIDMSRNYVCSYFFVKSDKFSGDSSGFPNTRELCVNNSESSAMSDFNNSDEKSMTKTNLILHPESLFTLCTQSLRKHLHLLSPDTVNANCHHISDDTIADLKEEKPDTLFRLCVNTLAVNFKNFSNHSPNEKIKEKLLEVLPLTTLCYKKITDLSYTTMSTRKKEHISSTIANESISEIKLCPTSVNDLSLLALNDIKPETWDCLTRPELKSLFSLCVKSIQNQQKQLDNCLDEDDKYSYEVNHVQNLAMEEPVRTPDRLNHIAFEVVKFHLFKNSHDFEKYVEKAAKTAVTSAHKVKKLADICFELVTKITDGDKENHSTIGNVNTSTSEAVEEFTINSVNTMSEEAYHNIIETTLDAEENLQYLEEEDEETNFYHEDDFDMSFNHEEDNQPENSWVSRVQMKELKSCFVPDVTRNSDKQMERPEEDNAVSEQPIPTIAQIKIEPIEDMSENVDSSIVKAEPIHNLDEMTVIPDPVVAKQENLEYPATDSIVRQNSSNYNDDTFEAFVRSSKMVHAVNENALDDIFSQSASRVRRQYEPDSDNEYIENDSYMNLLIPQTFEPLRIESAKDCLMESSSDGESGSKKKTGRKKPEKRGRARPRNTKQTKDASAAKEKVSTVPPPPVNEVAKLTKRMRDRIRQEEKKNESSESETENIPLNIRKDKDKKESEITKPKSSKSLEDEIQCNNVDSTEQIERPNDEIDNFSGFTAVESNEISSYQKYVQFVYDKIIPRVTAEGSESTLLGQQITSNKNYDVNVNEHEDNNRSYSPLINPDEPVEMLECEPTMPIFDKKLDTKSKKAKLKTRKVREKESNIDRDDSKYVERNGWKCYPIDFKDNKLLQNAAIFLEKLPESFVQTYFRYQSISAKSKEDEEVDKLTNLQSLNRSSIAKDGKVRPKAKSKVCKDGKMQDHTSNASRPATPANSDCCNELTPSEDERNVDDEVPPPAPRQATENNLAKNSLMDDNDSDSDAPIKKVKEEPIDPQEPKENSKRKPKSSPQKAPENAEFLMLTADKMMNKELNLLHAPVVLNEGVPQTSTKGPNTRNKLKSKGRTYAARDRIKNEDDSSSEEEKQWVNTKEKLLKRMGKKQDDTSVEDAKRAKLVSEFIERRGDIPEARLRGRAGRGRRRSSKKRLEREKQLRVLSKELFGESSADARHTGKQFSQSYFKGRRNIRKVIDKKSLARSTVIANMEEFERKCRLNQRQSRLRELLGCEEGVNVLVINNEVCLEYDFQEQQPVVTVHPFFTKVMKAHQYEGVKFMWDACFETLEKVESGHPGSGCILAHCMGLGKTLQVLALLHTVLTHPRVGMQRVLVCCPLSTVLNWVDEIHKWIGPVTDQIKPRKLKRKLQVFELSKLKKTYERAYQLEDWYSGGGIFIIGYELFRSLSTLDPLLDDVRPTIINKIRTALLDPGPDIIVCDEGHLLKNDCSVLAVAMSRVVTKRRIILTGTPMQNNLREYYCMVNFIKPNLLGTYSEYSNRFENPIMNGQHRDSIEQDIKLMKQRTHILHKVLEGCLQRQEASVLYPYLPKKHEYTVFISLTKCQWDLYKHYMENYKNNTQGKTILKDFHILQKIWSHPQVLHNFQMRSRDEIGNKIKPEKLEDDLAHEDLAATEDIKPSDTEVWWLQYLEGGKMLDCLDSSNKFVVVFRILEESIALGDKVLIFSTSLITMDALEYFLKKINKWSLGQEYYRLDGSVPAEVRQKWCREFNAENNYKTKLFLISTRAGSLGLNMVAANRVIILDTSWNPAHDIQSIFRVYRFGQKKDCYIYRLVALGTMEQKIYERSVTKQAVACRVVDEQQIDRHYNMAELTELYRYDEAGAGVAGGVAVGVTDVALLRVARHAALHAVHEHDSLLRGSSEQGLPEHERAAAWMQFQQEHAHKQMQNQLIPSFTLQTPIKRPNEHEHATPPILPEVKTEYPVPTPPTPTRQYDAKAKRSKKSANNMAEVKVETPNDTEYLPKPGPKSKKGKGKNAAVIKCRIPVQSEKPATKEALAIDDAIVKKIMNILIQHDFQNRQSDAEISELVSNVRKIVAYGKVPKGSFNKELTESIANVLLGKEPVMPPLTDVAQPTEENTEPKKLGTRTRRKQTFKSTPSTSKANDATDGVGKKRKVAVAAEKHVDSVTIDSVIDLADGDWRINSDTDSAPEIVPDKPRKPGPKSKVFPKNNRKQDNKSDNNRKAQTDSILLLSDDDEPVVAVGQLEKPAENEKADQEQVIPLHPSLLSNKNFIKIVAHTYLEGNPMLDEDAATLAAQYSTLKALKEVESTGNPIDSGPIYDIAVKVLGIAILKKLHKSNPQVKKTGVVPLVKRKVYIEPQEKPPPKEKIQSKEPSPKMKVDKPLPKVTAKVMSELMPHPAASQQIINGGFGIQPGASVPPPAPTVVPVGLIKRTVNLTPSEPFNPQVREESILPDDDDIIISDPTPPPATLPAALGRSKPQSFVVKSVMTKSNPPTSIPATMKKSKRKTSIIPNIQVSSGRIVLTPSLSTVTAPSTVTMNVQAPSTPTSTATYNDTICLDSDDEESITPNIQPAKRSQSKRVALKSTAKKQVVPVSLTMANPNAILPQLIPPITTQYLNQTQVQSAIKFQPIAPQPTKTNFVVIPASRITKCTKGEIPQGAVPLVPLTPQTDLDPSQNMNRKNPSSQSINLFNSIAHNITLMNPMLPNTNLINSKPHMSLLNPTTQNMNVMNTMPHNANLIHSAPQNIKLLNSQMSQTNTISQSLLSSVPNMNAITSTSQSPVNPESILPTKSAPPTKTVCKPGDILRITKTGEVEILNRGDQNADESAGASKIKATPETTRPHLSIPGKSHEDSQPSSSKTSNKKRIRKISSSSSSSSSDSSRPSTPDDPLSILKDVVHIRAADDDPEPYKVQTVLSKSGKPKTKIGNISITKSSQNSKNSTPAKTTSTSVTLNSLKEQIQTKKETVQKRLSKGSSTADKSGSSQVESVDLTNLDTPLPAIKTYNNKATSSTSHSLTKKKEPPSKIVGTSKSIIISGTGKALSTADTSGKKNRVINVEKVAQSTSAYEPWSELMKRRAVSTDTGAAKKKKPTPMTLKDFDIDDIDDIIELD